jgi:hypothetical protein
VICPKCGEDNSDNFRFCGMCGTLLESPLEPRIGGRSETRQSTGAPLPNLPISKSSNPANLPRPLVIDNALTPKRQVPAISGPSMLGLDQAGPSRSELGQRVGNETDPNPPSIDSLREKSFSGLDSFFEQEKPKTGRFRILLLIGLLAALGVAGWWTYTNYLGTTENRKAEVTTSDPTESPAETSPAKPNSTNPAASTPPAATSSAPVPAGQTEDANANSNASPNSESKTAEEVKPAAPVPAGPAATVRSSSIRAKKISPAERLAAKREASATARASTQLRPAATDTGDADFRKAEGYLYGRGAAENCDEAVKYLKAASAKSNAKARSTFGTMYATGHCAPRDLPTSYLWFAMALRVDPNNQILEKDLSAVWNQMTPPERQLATRMKQ